MVFGLILTDCDQAPFWASNRKATALSGDTYFDSEKYCIHA
jgi:hypothetical protein